MNFKAVIYSTLFAAIVLIWVSSNINWRKDKWRGLLESDAKGYYAYLPAVFIYQDLNFSFFDQLEKEKYYQEHLYYDYRIGAHNSVINKYYCGTAIAQMPFFFIAHALSILDKQDLDGYSKWYMLLINIAAICYHLLGILFLGKLLMRYELSKGWIFLILITASLGTNLFAYTIVEPGMSHVFSFAFISMFLYYSKLFFEEVKSRYLLIAALLLGLIVLCRPINGLILFSLPFIAGSRDRLKLGLQYIIRKSHWSLLALMLFIAVCSIQLIIYKLSTGHYFIYSYGQERFNFLDPHLFEILFSYKKGLFLYTPVYLVSLFGLIWLWKNSRFVFFSCLSFLILITYVFSSWWMWYYGGSFSSRVYVEYIPVFMILLAIGVKGLIKNWHSKIMVAVLLLLIIMCQVQTYQYRYYEIHFSDMNKERYWEVFMMRNRL